MNTRTVHIPGSRDTLEIPLPGNSGDWQGYGKALVALDDEVQRLQTVIDQLLDIASRMSQELQDFIGEAEHAGSPLPSVKLLVDEWETIHSQHNTLIKKLGTNTELPKGLANL